MSGITNKIATTLIFLGQRLVLATVSVVLGAALAAVPFHTISSPQWVYHAVTTLASLQIYLEFLRICDNKEASPNAE